MTDPRRPRPPRPTIPWTPFGPGDNATPDVQKILQQLAKTNIGLERAQLQLTEMRYGPEPDGTPPVVREVTRADGLWPYLLIRSLPGDVGARPLDPSLISGIDPRALSSPDIIVTPAGPSTEPFIVDRDGYSALEGNLVELRAGQSYDVWVHVWNLGRAQATGVRVRAFLPPGEVTHDTAAAVQPPFTFLGGRQFDLGDRLSDSAHRVIKAATFTPTYPGPSDNTMLIATAECSSDPASGDQAPGKDRHSAHRIIIVLPW